MLREMDLKTSDGLTLYGWTRQPAGRPKGVIVHVHGMGEHSRRYDHLTEYWQKRGYASAGFDHRGHGRSEGRRGHTPSLNHLLDDIATFLDRVVIESGSVPVCIYGHSMGGNLVLNYVIRRRPALVRVVASAPYLRLAFEPPGWKVRMARGLHWIAPTMNLRSGLSSQALSRDPAVISRYEGDPLVHDKITMSFFAEIHAAGEAALHRASELTLPTLVMHGSGDTITSPVASEEFVAASFGRAVLKIWEGFFHEIHNEPGWEAVAAFVLSWIETGELSSLSRR